jgi:hypothetical protein
MSGGLLYLAQAQHLVVVELDSYSVVWMGYPDGLRVSRVLWEYDTNDAIVLLGDEVAADKYYGNFIARCRASGEVVWKLAPPEGKDDRFTEMQLTCRGIFASTASCWSYLVDPRSGEVLVSAETH